MNEVKEKTKTAAFCSHPEQQIPQPKPRVTFKRRCKDDFITINVSGRRFQAENAIFERHPGI